MKNKWLPYIFYKFIDLNVVVKIIEKNYLFKGKYIFQIFNLHVKICIIKETNNAHLLTFLNNEIRVGCLCLYNWKSSEVSDLISVRNIFV